MIHESEDDGEDDVDDVTTQCARSHKNPNRLDG
jgi:hypothetical protein